MKTWLLLLMALGDPERVAVPVPDMWLIGTFETEEQCLISADSIYVREQSKPGMMTACIRGTIGSDTRE